MGQTATPWGKQQHNEANINTMGQAATPWGKHAHAQLKQRRAESHESNVSHQQQSNVSHQQQSNASHQQHTCAHSLALRVAVDAELQQQAHDGLVAPE